LVVFWAVLTLEAVGVEQLLALLVALDPALGATHALAGYSPQQPLTLVAVCGCGGGPHLKVVWRSAGYGVDESLQGLLVHMVFLQEEDTFFRVCSQITKLKIWSSCPWLVRFIWAGVKAVNPNLVGTKQPGRGLPDKASKQTLACFF